MFFFCYYYGFKMECGSKYYWENDVILWFCFLYNLIKYFLKLFIGSKNLNIDIFMDIKIVYR